MHVISIAPFFTANAVGMPTEFKVRKAYIETARKLLQPHNIAIEQAETGLAPGVPYMLDWDKPVNDERDGGKLRALCEDGNAFATSIPVIFCMLFQASDFGATVMKGAPQNDGKDWGPYILINIRLQSRYNAVLLHELIHAAYDGKAHGFKQPGHDGEATSIFNSCAPDGAQEATQHQMWLPGKHVTALRKADFTSFRP